MNTQIERAKHLIEEAYAILDKLNEGAETPAAVAQERPATPLPQPVVLKKGEFTYTGKIGRPHFQTTRTGLSLWKAGLGIDTENGQLEWLNLQAWRAIADHAQQFERGDTVTVTGKPGTERYADRDGVLIERDIVTVASIDWTE